MHYTYKKPLEINDEEPEDLVDKTPAGSVDEPVKYTTHLSPIISPREVSVKYHQEKIETDAPDEPDVYHSPVSPLHYPENNSRERCECTDNIWTIYYIYSKL